jgi:hypothetical protein
MIALAAPTMDVTVDAQNILHECTRHHAGDDAVGFLGATSGQPVVIPRQRKPTVRPMGTTVDNRWTAFGPVTSGHRYLSTIHRPYHHYQSIHQNSEQGNRSL